MTSKTEPAQWKNDLPDTWDEASRDPPQVETDMPTEWTERNGGWILSPVDYPDEGTKSTHSGWTDTVEVAENDPAERSEWEWGPDQKT